MFPTPVSTLELISPIPVEVRPRIEDLARLAILQPLAVGESMLHSLMKSEAVRPHRRLDYINSFIKKPRPWHTHEYLITVNGVSIGYAAAWTGYDPWEHEQHEPCLELLFLDPMYAHWTDEAKQKIKQLLPALKKD